MHLLTTLLLLLSTAAAGPTQKLTTSLTLRIPVTQGLPNPNVLPPSTHATLSTLGASRSAPLSTYNTFLFNNITAGSYLLDVFCATHAFAPLRVDVIVSAQEGQDLLVRAWETYRGNDWDNKGEALAIGEGNLFEVRLLGSKGYFMERSKCEFLFWGIGQGTWANEGVVNAFAILKNPMILLGGVSMLIFLGLPYLVDNSEFPVLLVPYTP